MLTTWKDIIDRTIADLKKDWGDEWEGRLFKLCADCGEGSLYQELLPTAISDTDRDAAIDEIDEYIKAAYGVEV